MHSSYDATRGLGEIFFGLVGVAMLMVVLYVIGKALDHVTRDRS